MGVACSEDANESRHTPAADMRGRANEEIEHENDQSDEHRLGIAAGLLQRASWPTRRELEASCRDVRARSGGGSSDSGCGIGVHRCGALRERPHERRQRQCAAAAAGNACWSDEVVRAGGQLCERTARSIAAISSARDVTAAACAACAAAAPGTAIFCWLHILRARDGEEQRRKESASCCTSAHRVRGARHLVARLATLALTRGVGVHGTRGNGGVDAEQHSAGFCERVCGRQSRCLEEINEPAAIVKCPLGASTRHAFAKALLLAPGYMFGVMRQLEPPCGCVTRR